MGNRPADGGITALGAVELRDRLASGALRAVEVVKAFLARIEAVEPQVQAFEWLDPQFAIRQAEACDAHRASGRPIGPLHGLPVALKDVIDTAKIPTRNGAALDAGRVPEKDAFVVQRLRAAGAIVLGKAVTCELAFLAPSKTRNPHNPAHTPGGSSSGSAAAVGAGMVPLAIGTQTGGSVIRPASYCGVAGFIPTRGAIPRTGVLGQSQTLDRIGVFARSAEDAALLAAELFGYEAQDKATSPAPHPKLLQTALEAPPVRPQFALVKTPWWDRATDECRNAIEELAGLLGEQCFETGLPSAFAEAPAIRERINFAEMARNYHRYWRDGRDALSPQAQKAIAAGMEISAADYLAALDWPDYLYAGLDEIFQRCDAILTPAATGPAPASLESTGDPIFNGLWTLTGVPAITIPLFEAANGMPIGVQLVGPRGGDGRLLRTARWLAQFAAAQS